MKIINKNNQSLQSTAQSRCIEQFSYFNKQLFNQNIILILT